MWIKVNVLSSFKNFQVFTLLDQKICFKNVLKEKITKAPAGFELITYIFVVNALTHCATVLSNYFGKDKVYKTVLDFFFISIGSTCASQYGVVSYHPNIPGFFYFEDTTNVVPYDVA